jgi:hypothetical protein
LPASPDVQAGAKTLVGVLSSSFYCFCRKNCSRTNVAFENN